MYALKRKILEKLKQLFKPDLNQLFMTQLVMLRMGSIDLMLSKFNSSHPNTQFTYKVEEEKTLSFLGVLLITNENFIEIKFIKNQ